MFQTEVMAKLEELIRDGVELVKDLREYVNERRAREAMQAVNLYGPRGTELRFPSPVEIRQERCAHGKCTAYAGGKYCAICGKDFPDSE